MKFLDPVALARVGTLPLRARTIVEGALSGLHRSPLHGASVEFAEHKEYAPGDELKHLDWKAYGKVDRFYVKRFEQETELEAHLLLDCSASMHFQGDGLSKLGYAAHVVGALAYLLNRQQDRAGLCSFGPGAAGRPWLPPRSRGSHLADLFLELEILAGGQAVPGPSDIAGVLARVGEQAGRRRALIVLVSDLFAEQDPLRSTPHSAGSGFDQMLKTLAQLRARRHDVAVVHVLDDKELTLPYEGPTLFESLEDSRKLLVDPRAIRRAYLDELEAFLARTRKACAEADVSYQLAPVQQPLERTLLDFLEARAGGNRRSQRPLVRQAGS
jgi:uncharacterized protein (DUF58 family)